MTNVSIHHISPILFTGYETYGNHLLLMASPEKALFDTLYLTPAKSNLFKRLVEVELPEKFQTSLCERWISHVRNKNRRVLIERKLDSLLYQKLRN